MAPARSRWIVGPRDPAAERLLADALGIHRLLAVVLVARGYSEPCEAARFLNPSLDDLGDPALLPDFHRGLSLILAARERGDRIFVHGDYDVDGVCTATLLGHFLKKIGCDVHVHVPHREREGYGIHLSIIAEAVDRGAKLFVTGDCGISAHEQVRAAKEAGMAVVVTDHHHVPEAFPEADAVINPHRGDSRYPFADLCGCGVAFRFCEGITREIGWPIDKFRRRYLDLAALATVADVMPLVGENRILAKHGLQRLERTPWVGLRALLEKCGLLDKRPLTSHDVGYRLGPRINAAGRIDDAILALRLLQSEAMDQARALAEEVDRLNAERQRLQNRAVEEAVARIEAQRWEDLPLLMLEDPAWNGGVIGLIAGKLRERYWRPACVGTLDGDGRFKFSARSVPGFHLAEAIRAHEPLLRGGGHALAAGFSVDPSMLQQAKEALLAYASQILSADDLVPTVEAVAEVSLRDVDLEAAEALEQLEPTGVGNSRPTFVARRVGVSRVTATRSPNAVVLDLIAEDGRVVRAVSFNDAEAWRQASLDEPYDVVFLPEVNRFNGRTSLNLKVVDTKPSD
ncbi:MAG: single-stranded-DNA-specific exonuclease RecJ [Fimbriimonadales bacterium]|nr:single-stranded-DNA-specific exonuclease RecJ [Fimbriimonadales bacterium]